MIKQRSAFSRCRERTAGSRAVKHSVAQLSLQARRDKRRVKPSIFLRLGGEEDPPVFTPRRDPHYASHWPLSHTCLLSPLLHLLMMWSCCDSPPTPLAAVLSACYHHEAAAWQGRQLSQLEALTCARQNSPPCPPLPPPPPLSQPSPPTSLYPSLTETLDASQPALTQQGLED